MRLDVDVSDDLPPMAWCAVLGRDDVGIRCGRKVRLFPAGIFEGGWSQTDCPSRCDPAGWYAGSGLFVADGVVKAISPSHTCEALYVASDGERTVVSNSLAFAAVRSGRPHLRLSAIGGPLRRLSRGIGSYPRRIFEDERGSISRHAMAIVEPLSGKERPHAAAYRFDRFEDYHRFLRRVLADIHDSAGCSRRVTYLSRGYDSAACAALMKDLGGGVALSLARGRTDADDDGAPIAARLGLECRPIYPVTRHRYKKGRQTFTAFGPEDAADAGEFCVGFGLADECLLVPAEDVSDSLVLTGFHGDRIWDLHAEPTPDIRRGDSSGSSLYEFRLRTGFVHAPVPMIGAVRHEDLHRIARSAEMSAWSVGGSYDRPVPRRIAEAAGVPRKMFGQKKSAVATASEPLGELNDLYFARLLARYGDRPAPSAA